MKWFLCFTFIVILHKSDSSDDIISVTIEQGEVIGKVEKTILRNQIYYSFKGIPFALTPVGGLRFKPPVKHKGWNGTYEAFVNKPTCFQYSPRTRNGESFGMSGSEDCLYLSVFTSDVKRSLPVIVFDYNDGFRSGFNGTRTYSPDFFVEGDVIVVTINHRLGLFGYLTTEDEDIPGNNGLRDFILGLQWVKDNIKHFGGDPNRITLMGNRGGAVLADILLYSDKAKNLFSAVILQSGTSLEPTLFYKEPREAAFRLGELVGINTTNSNTLLEEIQKIDAKTLITNEGEVMDTNNFELTQMAVFPFGPVVEKNNPDAVLKLLPDNEMVVNDVPIIIGMNSREGLDLISHFIFEPRLLRDLAQDFFVHIPKRSGFRFDKNSSVYENMVRDIQNFYLEEGYLYYANILEYAVYVGDVLQNYAVNYAARKLGKELKSDLYYYMFDFRGLLNENSEYMSRNARSSMEHWGATITDELCYLHLCSRIRKNYQQLLKLLSEQPEIKVLKKMVRLWTNFAKYRNPTPVNNDEVLKDFIWQPVKKNYDNINYLHITKKLQMRENPLGERAKFWDNFIAKYSALAKEGVVSDKNHDEL